MKRFWSVVFVLSLFFCLGAAQNATYACDTMVALPDATATGTTILGKNSDRPIYDCQPLMFNAHGKHAAGEALK
jgi:secernin